MAASIIQLLPDHVANQIAAGEVVQRPASVVKELLENAVDAKSSDIKLIVKEAGKTLVQVIDNGLGIDLEKFDGQLFELYKRFHPGIEGKGMGLYMVKMQVEKLKGNITVESKVGVGTTFNILFEKPDRPK